MHDPLEPYELKGLLTGSLRPFTSRMLFNYDFILKLQTPLIESSYWALEQGKRRDELTARFKHIEDKIHTYSDLQESKQMTEYDELQTQVRTTVNAKQKRAKQALSLWMMANDTKDLPARVLRFENNKQMREEYLGLLQELRVPTLNLDGKIECLKSWGFLVLDLDAALTLTLTLRGMCATEVNEGHTILMPLLADAECMKPLTGEEIAVVLATFLTDGIDSSDSTEASDVLNGVTSAWIQQTCKDCMALSASETPPEYWKLSHVWPVVVQRWLSGATVTEIAAEFGLFEGNVFRGLLRVANLLEEWSAIATLRKDLPTLEKLATLNFLRGEIVPDSLYLRL
jgi:superfamily II RNA helicase